MKLMLTGPQALTIFTIAKDEQVPASAKTSSFATPQGYYCTETNKLHLFIKGNEYCFIDMEEHERVVTEAVAAREPAHASSEEDGELTERLCKVEADLEKVAHKVHCMHKALYVPLRDAFESDANGDANGAAKSDATGAAKGE